MLLVFTIINPWLPVYKWTNLLPPFHEWVLLLWLCGILTTTLSNPPDKAGFGSIKYVNLVLGFAASLVHLLGAIFAPDEYIPYVLFTRNQLLALVLLLSFVELLNFLTFHHLFGPWAVIIQDLMKDMMRFLVIMGIFLIGFSLTVSAIYAPIFEPLQVPTEIIALGGSHQQLPAAQQIGAGLSLTPTMGLDFQSPLFTFEMLFYSLFGLVEPDFMPPMHSSPAISKVIMKLVFGIYMMITVVVLINLLIAMMSNTYQRIEARSDIEWKFGRAKLIRNMIRTSPTPSPLILLIGIWIDMYRDWRSRQASRQKVEKMAVAAFNREQSVSERAARAAQIWISKTPRLNAKRQLESQKQQARPSRTLNASSELTLDPANLLGGSESHLKGAVGGSRTARSASLSQMPESSFGAGVGHGSASLQGRQIHEVVNWPTVVRKYWESVGVTPEKEEAELSPENGNNQSAGLASGGGGQNSSANAKGDTDNDDN